MPLATALSFLVAAAVPAEPGSPGEVKAVEIAVEAPADCADTDRFFDSLRARTHLVRRATEGEPHARSLRVRLLELRRYVTGELRLVDDQGETLTRKVQGATCDDVLQALALTAAVALDPSVLLPSPAPGASSESTSASEAAPATASAAGTASTTAAPPASVRPSADAPTTTASMKPPPEMTASGPAPRFHLGAGSLVTLPLSSGPSAGLALFARWTPAPGRASWWPATLGLAVSYLRNDVLRSPDTVDAQLVGLGASACARGWQGSVMNVRPCASLMAGQLSATGARAVHARAVDVLWLRAGAAARAAIELGRGFAVELEAGVGVPLLRREFYVTSPGHVVDRTSLVSPEAALGIARGF